MLCLVGCLAVSLASTQVDLNSTTPTLVVKIKTGSKLGQMFPGEHNHPWFGTLVIYLGILLSHKPSDRESYQISRWSIMEESPEKGKALVQASIQ